MYDTKMCTAHFNTITVKAEEENKEKIIKNILFSLMLFYVPN